MSHGFLTLVYLLSRILIKLLLIFYVNWVTELFIVLFQYVHFTWANMKDIRQEENVTLVEEKTCLSYKWRFLYFNQGCQTFSAEVVVKTDKK